jgi:hypothetical protein
VTLLAEMRTLLGESGKLIKSWPAPEGMEVRVYEISTGYSVVLWDTDADANAGTYVFKKNEKAKAIAAAEKLVVKAGGEIGEAKWDAPGFFRTPTSVDDAKSQIKREKKNLKKAEAALVDAEKSQYSIGVKIAQDDIAMRTAAIAHFEAWLKAR